jgi:hypothetical protein
MDDEVIFLPEGFPDASISSPTENGSQFENVETIRAIS